MLPILYIPEIDLRTNVDGDDACEERHQSPLLELVAEDGRVRLSRGPHRQAGGRVPDSNCDAGLGAA